MIPVPRTAASMSPEPPAPYLLVKHSSGWNVDRCSRWMRRAGHAVEYRYPVDGEPLPDPVGYAGVIVFGGRWSANDCASEPWIPRELAFIERCLAAEVPFFGVCLGAQLLARVLGARVGPHAEGRREVGFHRVDPVPGEAAFLDAPLTVMQWHSEGFDTPAGCTRTATSELFPDQAFRCGERVAGVQFHPEVNPDVLAIWHERNRQRKPGDLTDEERARMRADALEHDAAVTAWLGGFLSRWTGGGVARPASRPAA